MSLLMTSWSCKAAMLPFLCCDACEEVRNEYLSHTRKASALEQK